MEQNSVLDVCAEVDGSGDAFATERLRLKRPEWKKDGLVSSCSTCSQPFNQIRRRHHCRQCGNIFCGNCSAEKIVLPYLGYTSKERVCSTCKDFANCMFMAASKSQIIQVQGAKALQEKCDDIEGCKQMFKFGGIHVLINLAKSANDQIKKEVVRSLKSLVGKAETHGTLANLGAIKAISSIINTSPHELAMQADSVQVFCDLCSDPEVQLTAVHHGILPVLASLFKSSHDLVLYRASYCMSVISQNTNTHQAFLPENDPQILPKLVCMLSHTHQQVLVNILNCLGYLTCYNEQMKQIIAQENSAAGGLLASVLEGNTSEEVVRGALCVTANLATVATVGVTGSFCQELLVLCKFIDYSNLSPAVNFHLIRAIANFAAFEQNCPILLTHLPGIAARFLTSDDVNIMQYAYRCTLHLLKFSPYEVIPIISSFGTQQFLHCLSETRDVLDTLISTSCNKLSSVTAPL